MASALFDQTIVDVSAGEYGFRATGTIMRFPGFTRVYDESSEEDAAKGRIRLPDLEEGEDAWTAASSSRSSTSPSRRRALPRPRWSRRSKITASDGPRPTPRSSKRSRRAGTSRSRSVAFIPTDIGIAVNDLLVEHFPKIVNLAFHRANGRRSRQRRRGPRRLDRPPAPLLRPVRKRARRGARRSCRGSSFATNRPTKSARPAGAPW